MDENKKMRKEIENKVALIGIDFDKLSFGALKRIFESNSVDLFDTENGKKIIKSYVNLIKKSPDLKTIFEIQEIVENPKNISDEKLFVVEVFSKLSIDKENFEKDKEQLKNIVKESVNICGTSGIDLTSIIKEGYESDIAIEEILLNNLSEKSSIVESINEMNSKKSIVAKRISEQKKVCKEEKSHNRDESFTQMIDYLNEALDELNIPSEIVIRLTSGETMKELFESYKSECLSLMEEKNNNNQNSELSDISNKLKSKEFNESTKMEDLRLLNELKDTLHEEDFDF